MRPAKARVIGSFDRAGMQAATVTMTRDGSPLFSVRPLRSRRTYELPLATVAAWCVQRIVKAELLKKKAEKAKARKLKRGRR